MIKAALTFVAVTLLTVPTKLFAQEERISAYSNVMEEERELMLHIPEGFETQKGPVVFVTDAKANFELVKSYLAFNADRWPSLPKMAVVGIVNVDRNRDFLMEPDNNFPNSGDGEKFARYLATELVPSMQDRFGPVPSILVGHSFGGVNALNLMFNHPQSFDAYIAIGTSTWVSQRYLFDMTRTAIDEGRDLDTWLYLAVAEADGGATVPDGIAYAELLEQIAPDELDWQFEIIERTNHFTAVPIALDRAFRDLFESWKDGESMAASVREHGPEGVDRWIKQRKDEEGWRFHLEPWDMYVTSFALHQEGQTEGAIRLLGVLADRYPSLPEVLVTKSQFHEAQGELEMARQAALRALANAETLELSGPRLTPVQNRVDELDGYE